MVAIVNVNIVIVSMLMLAFSLKLHCAEVQPHRVVSMAVPSSCFLWAMRPPVNMCPIAVRAAPTPFYIIGPAQPTFHESTPF